MAGGPALATNQAGNEGSMAYGKQESVTITAPNFQYVEIALVGTSPYVQHKFSEKAKKQMRDKMLAGSQAAKGRKREPRDFKSDYEQAQYKSKEGWVGIPASCFRNAIISTCRLVGFKMTLAKLSIVVEADGWDVDGITPLVKIDGKPEAFESAVRNDNGAADLRVRPIWRIWKVKIRVRFDADQFSMQDVINLIARVGTQVGIGEGRHDSPQSTGMGWGCFEIDKAVSIQGFKRAA